MHSITLNAAQFIQSTKVQDKVEFRIQWWPIRELGVVEFASLQLMVGYFNGNRDCDALYPVRKLILEDGASKLIARMQAI
jgi:hypothetical protein